MFDARRITKHIFNITGINSYILDMKINNFLNAPDYCLECGSCDYLSRHIYSSKEAERWSNRYIYYCNKGFTFIATKNKGSLSTLITGPMLMGEDVTEHSPEINVPLFSTKAVGSISEIIFDSYSLFVENDINIVSQMDILNLMYKESDEIDNIMNYLGNEKELETALMLGNKPEVKECINKMLGFVFLSGDKNFITIKTRSLQFIVFISHSIIKTHENSNEIFKLSSQYIKEIDNFKDIERLSFWLTEVIEKFLEFVIDLNDAKNKDIVHKITSYIKNNYTEKITLSDVSKHVFLSNSYLSKIINEEFECSFSDLVNNLRIEKSKDYLRTTNLSIIEISNAVGFESQSYFIKVFKNITGISPGKYRDKRI